MRLLWNDAEVATDPTRLREALASLGVRAGHRIGIVAGNTPLHVLMHVAARGQAWTLMPVGQEVVGRGAGRIVVSQCDVIVASTSNEGLAASWANLPILVCDPLGNPVRVHRRRINPPPPRPWPAVVLHTSGTTGEPHPVPITRAMLEAHAASSSKRLVDSKASVWLGVLGLHRIGAVAMLERWQRNGSTLLLHDVFDAEAVRNDLRKTAVTHVSLVPTMLGRVLEAWGSEPPPTSLQCVLLGGDRADETLVRPALEAGWPIWCTYGMTESTSQAATATPAQRLRNPGTSGLPLEGVKVDVVEGEIVLSGPTVVGGGPYATGDLGHLDGEGLLFVTGRKGDRITTGGVKVEPGPVEDALRTHPAVAEACVVGLPDPDWGERVVAALVLRKDQAMPSEESLRALLKSLLPSTHVPKAFVEVAAIPRSEAGKMQRSEMRALLQATVPT